jgi:2,3-bisphosphoglycerate-independent phosphoglycerate mutase
MKKTVVLLILDGFGIGRKDTSNPIFVAKPATLNFLKKNYRYGLLEASGIAVGLPWGEEGNSEVGHITLGAGKVVYQHYPRITLAIQNESFFKNEVLRKNFAYAISKDKAVHLIGALTSGHVHAATEHLLALIKFAKNEGVKKLYLHLITDGRDSAPRSAPDLLKEVEAALRESGVGQIATIGGRYYGMDRDEHRDRTAKFYDAIFQRGKTAENAFDWLQKNYAENLNDEYIEPAAIGYTGAPQDGDSVIFFNFREDSIKQLAESFAAHNFSLASFTNYGKDLNIPVAFPEESVVMPLGRALAEHGKTQIRIAETEKYAHVTYFWNGLKEEHFENEYRVLIPSENIARHDEHPEMRAKEIGGRVVSAVGDGGGDFILANFANPDVIAHTGNFDAGIKAVQVIDDEVKRIYDACLAADAALIITSDHGNLEQMRNPLTGEVETKHNPNPVPIHIIGREFVNIKSWEQVERSENEIAGILADVAPTVLDILGLPIPPEMTGVSLLNSLR